MESEDHHSSSGFLEDFKKFFLRGVGALLPTLLTIAILIWAYQLVDAYIGQYITEGFIEVLARTAGAPTVDTVDPDIDTLKYGTRTGEMNSAGQWLTQEFLLVQHPAHQGDPTRRGDESLAYRRALWGIAFAKYKLGLVGFLLAIALVYFMGFFVASFIGRTAWGVVEKVQARVPLVNAVYPHVKQITDFLLSEKRVAFSAVVAVEYPRREMWSLGLLTGEGLRELSEATGQEMVSIFIPSSPTPVTGYVIVVPRADVVMLKTTIDQALRFTISGGVIKPESGASGASRGKGEGIGATVSSFRSRPLAAPNGGPPTAEPTPEEGSGPGAESETSSDETQGTS